MLNTYNDAQRRNEAIELERQRIEQQRLEQQRAAQFRAEWCSQAMAELGRPDLHQMQKMAIFETMRNRGCMGP
jgi:hypothetical protein